MCYWFCFFPVLPSIIRSSLWTLQILLIPNLWPYGPFLGLAILASCSPNPFLSLIKLTGGMLSTWYSSSLPPVHSAFQQSCGLEHQLWISKVLSALIPLDFSEVKNVIPLTASHCFCSTLVHCCITTHYFSLLFPISTVLPPSFKFRTPEKFVDFALQTHMQSKYHSIQDFPQSCHLPPFLLLFHVCEPRGWAKLRPCQWTRNTHLQITFEKHITKVLKRELL